MWVYFFLGRFSLFWALSSPLTGFQCFFCFFVEDRERTCWLVALWRRRHRRRLWHCRRRRRWCRRQLRLWCHCRRRTGLLLSYPSLTKAEGSCCHLCLPFYFGFHSFLVRICLLTFLAYIPASSTPSPSSSLLA